MQVIHYLSTPIGTAFYLLFCPQQHREAIVTKKSIETSVQALMAAVGYVAATHFSPRWGITLPQAACLTAMHCPTATHFAVAGHMMVACLYHGCVEGKKGHFVSAIQQLALALFAYTATTPRFYALIKTYVYRDIPVTQLKNVVSSNLLVPYISRSLITLLGYVVAFQLNRRYKFSLEQMACFTILTFVGPTRLAILGHTIVTSISRAITAGRSGQQATAVQHIALAVFAASAFTIAPTSTISGYVCRWLKIQK